MNKTVDFEIRWYNKLQVKVLSIVLALFLLLTIIVVVIASTLGASLVEQLAYQKLADAGHRVVAELESQTVQAASLADSLAKIAAELPVENDSFKALIRQVIDHSGSEHLIAGGGVWPEPFQFRADKERDSFFWGRDSDGRLQFFDDYNVPESAGYHHEEWYVPTRYLQKGETYWSKSYTDPHSMQPMITVSVPMHKNDSMIGVATIDLKLEGLQALLRKAAREFGGYAFVIDRNGRFLSFPDDKLARYSKLTTTNGSLIPFLNIAELAKKQSEFGPLASLLGQYQELLTKQVPEQEKEYTQLATKLAAQSYQIEPHEAQLIAGILLESSVVTSHFDFNERHAVLPQDYFLQETAYVSVTTMPGTYWRVVTVMPSSEAHKEAGAIFNTFIFMMLLSIVVAMALFWLVLRHKLTKPFLRLAEQLINSTRDTDNAAQLIHIDDQSELGMLANLFNRRTEQVFEGQQEIERLAFFDVLTGLPNRRLLLDHLREKQAIAERQKSSGAVFFLDLDHFKTLNDSLGHSVGDELLIQAGRRLTRCLRDNDTVARIGGDEFVVVALTDSEEGIDADVQATTVAQKITDNMSHPFELEGNEYHVTVSIGISLFTGESQGVGDIIKQADTAMYQAKSNGRNNFCFFEESMQDKANERLRIQEELRRAIEKDELELHYQPQVIANGHCRSVEALVRWRHPIDGMIPPGAFIPIAEESVLVLSLGSWVLGEACRQMSQWNDQGLALQHVSVNVSPRQFEQQDFIDIVKSAIESSRIKPQQLMLEITEGVILGHADEIIERMHALRKLGVAISMDDFGTGYSSLTYLKQLPLDQLKIDQSFVRDIMTDSNDAVIVEMIIAMARQFGYQVIAEGVETKGQQQLLQEKGCVHYQGYYFSRPLSVDEFNNYINAASDEGNHSVSEQAISS